MRLLVRSLLLCSIAGLLFGAIVLAQGGGVAVGAPPRALGSGAIAPVTQPPALPGRTVNTTP